VTGPGGNGVMVPIAGLTSGTRSAYRSLVRLPPGRAFACAQPAWL